MTSTVSTDKSYFGKYFLYKLSSLKIHLIFSIIFSISAMPVPALIFWMMMKSSETVSTYDFLYQLVFFGAVMCLVSFVILFTLFLITPAVNFSYYNKRDTVDMYGALPLTVSQRFWADWLSGYLIGIVPFAVCGLPAVLLISDVHMLNDPIGTYFLGLICFSAVYVFSAFMTVCCGKFASSILFSLLLMGALAALTALAAIIIYSRCQGVDIGQMMMTALRVIPPIGTAISFIVQYYIGAAELVIAAVITALFMLGTYFLAKRRPAERTGKQFAYNAVYHVITVMLLITVFELLLLMFFESRMTQYNGAITALALVGTLIPLMFLELAHYRSFALLWRSFIKYIAAAAGSVGLYFLLVLCGGFGVAYYVPAVADVEYANVSYYGDNSFEMLTAVDEEIQQIIECHSRVIPPATDLDSDNGISRIEFNYVLNNGEYVERSYSLKQDGDAEAAELFEDLGGISAVLSQDPNLMELSSENVCALSKGLPYAHIYRSGDQKALREALIKDSKTADDGGDYIGYVPLDIRPDHDALEHYFRFSGNVFITDKYTETLKFIDTLGTDAHPVDPFGGYEVMVIATDEASYTLYKDNEREYELAQEIFKYLYVTPKPDRTGARLTIEYLNVQHVPPLAVNPEYEETVIRLLKEKTASDDVYVYEDNFAYTAVEEG